MTDAASLADSAEAGPPRFAAFISYCHADARAARALQRFLETYRLPRDVGGAETDRATLQARLRPVFLDRADMPAGTDLREEIEAALAASATLIVVCSPAAAKSFWVNLEIERFRQLHGDSRIFAVIIDGIAHAGTHSGSAERECFPPALRIRDTPRGPERADPAAVDIRRSADGSHVGRLRLVAGLVGVPLDQLVHRDARRRHRRILALVIGLALALAGTTALALYALAARNEAQRQRFAAEGMIEFMIGDLRKTLEPMGRLSAMDPLGKKALDYYRQQDAADLDADSLGRRARVLLLVGEIQDQRGNLDVALRNFEVAAATTRELLERTPDDPRRIFDHAQSVYWVGYIAYRRGNFAAAEPAFREYSRLGDRLVAIDPKNAGYEGEVAYAYGNLGTLWFAMGRNSEAESALRTSLAVAEKVAARNPRGIQEQLDLATAHAWVANTLERQGKLEAAMAERARERAALDLVLAADTANSTAAVALANAKRAQARISLAQGNTALALALAKEAAREATGIAALDVANTDYGARAAAAHVTLGEVQLANGNIQAAVAAAANARRFATQLTTRDRSVASWQLDEVREMLLRARILREIGATDQALALAEEALGIIAALPERGRDVSDARWLRNSAWLQAAELYRILGNNSKAAQYFSAIEADSVLTKEQEEPRIANLRAAALKSSAPDLSMPTS